MQIPFKDYFFDLPIRRFCNHNVVVQLRDGTELKGHLSRNYNRETKRVQWFIGSTELQVDEIYRIEFDKQKSSR